MIPHRTQRSIGNFRFNARLLAVAAVLVVGAGFAIPAEASVELQPAAATVSTMTPKRIGAILAIVVALIGAVNGGRAFARAAGRAGAADGRRKAIAALILGPIGLAGGGLVVVTASGGLGTGNGLGGGVVAMVVGLIGMTLGWLALVRSRRAT